MNITHGQQFWKLEVNRWGNKRNWIHLKEAWRPLLANLVARPACHRAVVHFRCGCIVQPGPVELLVLLQALCDRRRPDRRHMGVTGMRDLHQLPRIIECPVESQRCWMTFHGTNQRYGLLLQRTHNHLAPSLLAHRGVCEQNCSYHVRFQLCDLIFFSFLLTRSMRYTGCNNNYM